MYKVVFSILAILFGGTVGSQDLDFTFSKYTTSQGLSSNHVSAIAQDQQGFIWIGHSAGLQRFDGIRFVSLSARTILNNQLLIHPISQLLVDKQNRLWILFSNGNVARLDSERRICEEIRISPDPENKFRATGRFLLHDEMDHIFLLDVRKELLIFQEDSNQFSGFKFKGDDGGLLKVTGLAHQPGTNNYWVSFENQGLFVFQNRNGTWSNTLVKKSFPGFPRGPVPYNFLIDRKNRLWIQEWLDLGPTVWCFDLSSDTVVLPGYPLMDLVNAYFETGPFFESKEGEIWVAGSNIFARFNEEKKIFQPVRNGYFNERSISFKVINGLYADVEKNIWVGTNDNGVYRFNPSREHFTNVPHLNRRTGKPGVGSPTSFFSLPDQTTLVSTWGDGLYRYDAQWNEIPLGIKNIDDKNEVTIWCLMQSKVDSQIWMSQQPAGLWSYNYNQGKAIFHPTPALENRSIRQIAEDQLGDFWLGMHGTGLYHWKREQGQFDPKNLKPYEFIGRCIINKITVDHQGLIWVATDVEGLYVIESFAKAPVMHFSDQAEKEMFKLPEKGTASALDYNDSLMILATSSSIHIYNRKSNLVNLLGRPGIINGYIAGLIRDRKGFLWITTTSGLYRVHLKNRIFLRFDRQDGIDDEIFTLSSHYEMPDQRLAFGGSEQFIVFDPAAITFTSEVEPEIVISDFRINSQPLPVDSLLRDDRIEVRYNQNALEIDYTTLTYSLPYLIRYKMNGLDNDWRTSPGNSAIYSYLPPGDYKFELTAEDPNGTVTRNRSIAISVRKPLWKTWWFYCSLGLIGFTILYFFDRERMRRKEQLISVRGEIARNLHGEINTALSSINILSEVARIKVAKDPTKAREYLDQITNKSQSMISAMDDILWTLAPENDSVEKVVSRLENYVARMSSQEKVRIDLLVDPGIHHLKLDMQTRQVLIRIFKGSITNLTKVGADELHLHLGSQNHHLEFHIEFDAEKMDVQLFNNILQREELKNMLRENKLHLNYKIARSKGFLQLDIPYLAQ